MGRRPCIALLLCLCSCSLDTTPDIPSASEDDASRPLWQQSSLRFDAPVHPPKTPSAKRAQRDDGDAGADAKPNSRDAGRSASNRPAMTSRDAGAVDASAKQSSSKPASSSSGGVSNNGQRPASSQMTAPSSPSENDWAEAAKERGARRQNDRPVEELQRARNPRGRGQSEHYNKHDRERGPKNRGARDGDERDGARDGDERDSDERDGARDNDERDSDDERDGER